jgi:hypothetical protein
MPWTTIIVGILLWTVGAFVITVVIKLLIDLLPSNHMDKIIENEEADFVSFQLKRKELESMLANIQGARAEIKEMIQKIDEVTEGGSEEDEQ